MSTLIIGFHVQTETHSYSTTIPPLNKSHQHIAFIISVPLYLVNKIYKTLRDIASLRINLSLKTVQISPPIFGQFCEKKLFCYLP